MYLVRIDDFRIIVPIANLARINLRLQIVIDVVSR